MIPLTKLQRNIRRSATGQNHKRAGRHLCNSPALVQVGRHTQHTNVLSIQYHTVTITLTAVPQTDHQRPASNIKQTINNYNTNESIPHAHLPAVRSKRCDTIPCILVHLTFTVTIHAQVASQTVINHVPHVQNCSTQQHDPTHRQTNLQWRHPYASTPST